MTTASAKKAAAARIAEMKQAGKSSPPKTIPIKKRKSRAESASKKEVAASVSSREINDQIKEFLKSGGKIQKIPNGVSGQPSGQLPTRKHIVISPKK
jgi:hypothetical protein